MKTENQNHSDNPKVGNISKPLLAPVIFWQNFEKLQPNPDEEYLVVDFDNIIKISYFDGVKWGYYQNSDDDILYWSILPKSPCL